MNLPVTQRPLTPPDQFGFYDLPFIYALNYFIPKTGPGSNPGINGGGFYANQWTDTIQAQGDYEFRLRRHVPLWERSFNLLDAGSNSLYSPYDLNPTAWTAAANNPIRGDQIIAPELVFPPNTGIRVQNNNGYQFAGLDDFWYGYYYMQGVKRVYRAPNRVPNYPYSERSYTYTQPFTLESAYPWTNTFYVQIENYDWEFQALFYTNGYGNVPTVSAGEIGFQIKLYDPGRHAMMSDYVDIETVTISSGIGLTGCFPTPPVIYPRGSFLQIDVQSVALAVGVPAQVELNLVGVNRVPC